MAAQKMPLSFSHSMDTSGVVFCASLCFVLCTSRSKHSVKEAGVCWKKLSCHHLTNGRKPRDFGLLTAPCACLLPVCNREVTLTSQDGWEA